MKKIIGCIFNSKSKKNYLKLKIFIYLNIYIYLKFNLLI